MNKIKISPNRSFAAHTYCAFWWEMIVKASSKLRCRTKGRLNMKAIVDSRLSVEEKCKMNRLSENLMELDNAWIFLILLSTVNHPKSKCSYYCIPMIEFTYLFSQWTSKVAQLSTVSKNNKILKSERLLDECCKNKLSNKVGRFRVSKY